MNTVNDQYEISITTAWYRKNSDNSDDVNYHKASTQMTRKYQLQECLETPSWIINTVNNDMEEILAHLSQPYNRKIAGR